MVCVCVGAVCGVAWAHAKKLASSGDPRHNWGSHLTPQPRKKKAKQKASRKWKVTKERLGCIVPPSLSHPASSGAHHVLLAFHPAHFLLGVGVELQPNTSQKREGRVEEKPQKSLAVATCCCCFQLRILCRQCFVCLLQLIVFSLERLHVGRTRCIARHELLHKREGIVRLFALLVETDKSCK